MEPTKSTFTKTVETPNGHTRTLQRALTGEEFLEQWGMENTDEVDQLKQSEGEQNAGGS